MNPMTYAAFMLVWTTGPAQIDHAKHLAIAAEAVSQWSLTEAECKAKATLDEHRYAWCVPVILRVPVTAP